MTDDDWVTLDDPAIVEQVLLASKNGAEPEPERAWAPLKANAFLNLPEPAGVELLGPLVLRGGRTLIGGDSGHGKTTLSFAMVAAILLGTELLGHTGAKLGPALVIDLEQGVRSIKRGIRDAGLDNTDTHILNLPDGLALDQNPTELAELEDVIFALKPVVIVLDPYYKAHRGDANEERAVTDLMRNLDRLRTDYLFALILPAHVRKEPQAAGVRKLTLADIAGSGAISRGAEVVLGLERLSHGQARLRYLKDREGDLPVGDALDLSYGDDGFTVNEVQSSESIEDQILAVENSGWMTTREWCKEIGLGHNETKRVLERMAAMNPPRIDYEIGPHGRSSNAKCYSTSGVLRVPVQSSTPSTDQGQVVGVPTVLTPLRSRGSVSTQPDPPSGVPSTPVHDDDIPF